MKEEASFVLVGLVLGLLFGFGICWAYYDIKAEHSCARKGGLYIEGHCLKVEVIK